jgi:plasmid stabilization system protein ParE
MAEYRLSPAAERDLEAIWKYTRREWGPEQAERYTDLLTAAFRVLAKRRSPLRRVIIFDRAIAAAMSNGI